VPESSNLLLRQSQNRNATESLDPDDEMEKEKRMRAVSADLEKFGISEMRQQKKEDLDKDEELLQSLGYFIERVE
jgi:hypothetical protein